MLTFEEKEAIIQEFTELTRKEVSIETSKLSLRKEFI